MINECNLQSIAWLLQSNGKSSVLGFYKAIHDYVVIDGLLIGTQYVANTEGELYHRYRTENMDCVVLCVDFTVEVIDLDYLNHLPVETFYLNKLLTESAW